MKHCLLFTRILKMSCKAAIKLFCKILGQKYYVVGIKTVVVFAVVAIKYIKPRVFFLRKILSHLAQKEHRNIFCIYVIFRTHIKLLIQLISTTRLYNLC